MRWILTTNEVICRMFNRRVWSIFLRALSIVRRAASRLSAASGQPGAGRLGSRNVALMSATEAALRVDATYPLQPLGRWSQHEKGAPRAKPRANEHRSGKLLLIKETRQFNVASSDAPPCRIGQQVSPAYSTRRSTAPYPRGS
jgi:hypothetical protein